MTESIAQIDAKKKRMIAEARFPVPGLSMDDSGIRFHGVPLAQASAAESLTISAAIGLALAPELNVMFVRDASLLDKESMNALLEVAKKFDAQIWIERVSDGDDVTVVIEDGEIKQ